MASPTRTLTVNFVGRTANLEKSFKRVSKGSALMSDKMMRATRTASIGFTALAGVAVGAAMALKPMIDKAASMEESLSKNRVVFGVIYYALIEQLVGDTFWLPPVGVLHAKRIFDSQVCRIYAGAGQ